MRIVHFEAAQIISDILIEIRVAQQDDAGFPIDNLRAVLWIHLPGKDVVHRLLKKVSFASRMYLKRSKA